MKAESGKPKADRKHCRPRVDAQIRERQKSFGAVRGASARDLRFGVVIAWGDLLSADFSAADAGWFFDRRRCIGVAVAVSSLVAGDPLLWYCRCVLGTDEIAAASVSAGWPEIITVTQNDAPLGRIIRLTPEDPPSVGRVLQTIWSGSHVEYQAFCGDAEFGRFAIHYPHSPHTARFELERQSGAKLPILGNTAAQSNYHDTVLPVWDAALTGLELRMYFMLQVICRLRLAPPNFD